ncbi:1-deoxy-11-beta-hydroxypentalenate dehydrogenase [Variibacter gotjawalensis]|uniref:1-deoxy-11-beta-hydroxypentalenate dehydrogenase n=1 Tax=Variibacter gotjawalensis TaxID=1333996 RepID=A0A0S3PRC3_9BRAD|nr:SDR family oxidoreductase [Variibacter gotjawalensis]NIK48721.1 NAD(P)-dependent dehydrogenase (short-subunit alcohol dehydrogenase family) [Variibacter gotjawalensis]RZS50582.1 short-subunit dehydrogenase [Variibacter gotjawalensis]BAT58416.1 1-deoxy-11-beta-hydroxypentalenate dehydrogenase [Variibacter gotjawalensis]
MRVAGKIVVVTGGGGGIGKALAEAFHREGAKHVVVADRDAGAAEAVAKAIGGTAHAGDVGDENTIKTIIDETEKNIGPIDLFCSNAGVGGFRTGDDSAGSPPNESWALGWSVNVMAHVYAARHLVPLMKTRGGGTFMNTVSAAGLLSQVGNPVYAVTKHAAVGFAEYLALTHKDDGIRVSILCPQGVDTAMLRASGGGPQNLDGVLTPEQCAQAAIDGLAAETFCILPHPVVGDYMKKKTDNYDRWIGGMAKMRRALVAGKN